MLSLLFTSISGPVGNQSLSRTDFDNIINKYTSKNLSPTKLFILLSPCFTHSFPKDKSACHKIWFNPNNEYFPLFMSFQRAAWISCYKELQAILLPLLQTIWFRIIEKNVFQQLIIFLTMTSSFNVSQSAFHTTEVRQTAMTSLLKQTIEEQC